MTTSRTDQQSGRFDATGPQQDRMLAQIRRTCTNAVLTEAMKIHPNDMPGWGREGTETLVVWDQSECRAVHHDKVVIPTPTWHRGTSKRHEVEVPYAVLEFEWGLLLRGGGHLPAHPPGRAANLAALKGLEPAFAPIQKLYHPAQTTLSFDVNRRLTSRKQVDLINHHIEGLGLHLVVPPKPTHRTFAGIPISTIDGYCTDADLEDVEMLSWMPGYDHRGSTLTTCVR